MGWHTELRALRASIHLSVPLWIRRRKKPVTMWMITKQLYSPMFTGGKGGQFRLVPSTKNLSVNLLPASPQHWDYPKTVIKLKLGFSRTKNWFKALIYCTQLFCLVSLGLGKLLFAFSWSPQDAAALAKNNSVLIFLHNSLAEVCTLLML